MTSMKYKIDKKGNITISADLFLDMAITVEKMADHFNCNDGGLENMGLDWWYHHKIRRRVQHITDQLKTG